jgi:hypothetical protein
VATAAQAPWWTLRTDVCSVWEELDTLPRGLDKESAMSTCLFENAGQPTSQRFASLEALYDPWTICHLEATGIGPGWQCS